MGLFGRLRKEHWNEFLGVFLVIFAIWLLISLLGHGGRMGVWLADGLMFLIGHTSYLLAVLVGYWGVNLFSSSKRGTLSGALGSICLLLSGLVFVWLLTAGTRRTVGILGEYLGYWGDKWIGTPGLVLAGIVFLAMGVTLASELTFSMLFGSVFRGIKRLFSGKKKTETRTVVAVDEPPADTEEQAIEYTEEEEEPEEEAAHESPIIIFDGLDKGSLNSSGYQTLCRAASVSA